MADTAALDAEIARSALADANTDRESVIELTRALVRIPSRGGIDDYQPIIDTLRTWLTEHGMLPTLLTDAHGACLGMTVEITGARPGPRWVFDTCLDTAPFGDENAWRHPPTSAVIDDGWLHGRGSADSKAGAAIFAHIGARLARQAADLTGTVVLLFDLDEHTGGFGGAATYFTGPHAPTDIAGVMIGYPGDSELVIGGRGVHRARLRVHGVASHSGGSTPTPNAIVKAAELIALLSTTDLPTTNETTEFPKAAKLTVTQVAGGSGYSQTPDLCTIGVDIRTTPAFNDDDARKLLEHHASRLDSRWPTTRPTLIETETRWPPYALPTSSPLRTALMNAAATLGVHLTPKIAGPANIGNFLAGLNIPATAGYGVDYQGLHATDERIRLDTIPTAQAVYHTAIQRLTESPDRDQVSIPTTA